MPNHPDLDAIRLATLQSVRRTDLLFKGALFAAAACEAGGLVGLMLVADFKDRTHQLILVQTLLVYGTLAIGMMALGVHVHRSTLRVLAALDPATRPE